MAPLRLAIIASVGGIDVLSIQEMKTKNSLSKINRGGHALATDLRKQKLKANKFWLF